MELQHRRIDETFAALARPLESVEWSSLLIYLESVEWTFSTAE